MSLDELSIKELVIREVYLTSIPVCTYLSFVDTVVPSIAFNENPSLPELKNFGTVQVN